MESNTGQQKSNTETEEENSQPIVASPATQSFIAPTASDETNATTPNTPVASQISPSLSVNHPVSSNPPGVIVLQWLTYAFWGWTILAMSILTITVLANFIKGSDTGGFTPYGIAAILVLLPISIVCDVFYSKKEPEKKTGAASIVMVIHAVLFALFCVGAIIAIVFSLVSMFTSSSDTSNVKVALYSAIIISILYGATLLRTINPSRIRSFRRIFIMFMTIVVGIIAVLGIIGPVAHERTTRNDRLISENLNSLKSNIDSYAKGKNRLPDKLSDLELAGDTKVLVEKNLVKYTPNTLTSAKIYTNTSASGLRLDNNTITYYYQLCVTYTKASKDDGYYSTTSLYKAGDDGYVEYIDSYQKHSAGEKCYKVKTNDYSY